MHFVVLIPPKVEKQITLLPPPIIEKLLKNLSSLETNPFPQNSKKLRNRMGYRLRIGDYRIIYEIDVEEKSIVLLRVAHRKDIYKK